MTTYKSWDEAKVELEKYRNSWRGRFGIFWHNKVVLRFKAPRRLKGKIINTIQRAKRGYGYQDIWSADQYLAKVISSILREYATNKMGVGYPYMTIDGNVDEEYKIMQEDYLKHAAMFEEYAKNGYAYDINWKKQFGGLTEKELKYLMKWFGKVYSGLWD
jgi:hypothetical protein